MTENYQPCMSGLPGEAKYCCNYIGDAMASHHNLSLAYPCKPCHLAWSQNQKHICENLSTFCQHSVAHRWCPYTWITCTIVWQKRAIVFSWYITSPILLFITSKFHRHALYAKQKDAAWSSIYIVYLQQWSSKCSIRSSLMSLCNSKCHPTLPWNNLDVNMLWV